MDKVIGNWLLGLCCISWLNITCVANATAGDLAEFRKIAEETIATIHHGKVDNVDQLIVMQERLIQIATQACKQHATRHPEDAEMFRLVTDNAEAMKNLSLAEMHELWHANRFLLQHGVNVEKMWENTVTGSLMDTVVHPATAYIALTQYKQTKNQALLQQVNQELSEAIYHISQIP
ncbi:hypothetical protein [Kaarinaea lacus]